MRYVYPLLLTALFAGCADQQRQGPSYVESIQSEPIPYSEKGRQQACSDVRVEYADQQNRAMMVSQLSVPLFQKMAALAEFNNRLAALNSRAALLHCDAAFSSNTVIEKSSGFSQACFDTCAANTTKTKDQCFDACNK